MASTLLWVLGVISSSLLGALTLTTQSSLEKFIASLNIRAEVYYPGSKEFADAGIRWSAAQTPHYDMIVKVASEDDVPKTVRLLIFAVPA